jgi:hypothetical protein
MYTNNFIAISPNPPYTTSVITVTVTDSSTGLIYFVTFANECTQATGNFACEATAGREQVLDSDYNELRMTDNGDNTYSATTTISRPGAFTYFIHKYTQGGVYNEYFSSLDWSGTNEKTNITATLDHSWSGTIFNTYSDASANFYFKLLAPVTGAYYFYLSHDDYANLRINDNNILNVV